MRHSRSAKTLFAATSALASRAVHTSPTYDIAIIGGGILGINIAQVIVDAAARRTGISRPRMCVLERENSVGEHGSGRNSGVLHSGLYYPSSSLKARFCAQGNTYLREYAARKGLPLHECGKVIVARHESELPALENLFTRAKANGVVVEPLTAAQATEKEPLVTTRASCGVASRTIALWSPRTAVTAPLDTTRAQAEDARAAGVDFIYGAPHAVDMVLERIDSGGVRIRARAHTHTFTHVHARHVVNAAGLWSDALAHQLGFGLRYECVPFKGLYMYVSRLPLRRLVYPLPEAGAPFLGPHFTITAEGKVKIGPTATPALWREHYGDAGAPWLRGFMFSDAVKVVAAQAKMLLRQPHLRRLAFEETRKYLRKYMIQGAEALLQPHVRPEFGVYGRSGIRAQLVHKDTSALEMDYVLEGDQHSTHVLNSVSPGYTSSRPFAEFVVDRMREAGVDV